jgi:hypothetical protein
VSNRPKTDLHNFAASSVRFLDCMIICLFERYAGELIAPFVWLAGRRGV